MANEQDDRLVEPSDLISLEDDGGGEAEADKKAIEQWAEAKGMWPPPGAPGSGVRAGRDFFKFAGARQHASWADGQLVTEAEFDTAVKEALSLEIR